MNGYYEESLTSGGKLVVTENSWNINYYFPGPDLRYNGTHYSVSGSLIDEYIKAWINNFEKIKLLQSDVPDGGDFEQRGEMGMYIHVNKNGGYVTIDRYNFSVRDEYKLHQVVKDYLISKKKAEILMKYVYEMAHLDVTIEYNVLFNTDNKQKNELVPDNQYTDNDIANAYNLLLDLKNSSFTKSKALKLFNGLYDEKMLEAMKQEGILSYNRTDDDWKFFYNFSSEGRKGALWVINYYLKSCDPKLLEAAELIVLKNKTDFDYIQEKLDLPDDRIERIKRELYEMGIIEKSIWGGYSAKHYYYHNNDIYEYIAHSYNIFNSKLKIKNES